MSAMFRRGLLAAVLFVGFAAGAVAQQAAKTTAQPAAKLQGFPTPDAAANALADAVRKNDRQAIAAMWGANWRDFVPGTNNDVQRRRGIFLMGREPQDHPVGRCQGADRGRQGRLDLAHSAHQGRQRMALRRRRRPEGDGVPPHRP